MGVRRGCYYVDRWCIFINFGKKTRWLSRRDAVDAAAALRFLGGGWGAAPAFEQEVGDFRNELHIAFRAIVIVT